jgi:hypothetical protein
MPLFFIIAIACGAATVGATTVDVTQDARAARAQAHAVSFDASAYSTGADCRAAAAQAGVSLSACSNLT